MRVAQELDIADVEHHMQRKTHARLFEDLGSFLLRFGQWRKGSGVPETFEAVDVVGVPFAVDAAMVACFFVEDWLAHIGLLAGGDLAFAVPVPDRLAERLSDVGMFVLQSVEDVMGADDVALASF